MLDDMTATDDKDSSSLAAVVLERSSPRAVRIRASRTGVQRPEVGGFPRKE